MINIYLRHIGSRLFYYSTLVVYFETVRCTTFEALPRATSGVHSLSLQI